MIQINQTPTGQRYADIQHDVERRFPTGRFVAVEGGQVIADAEDRRELVEKLKTMGKSPRNMLIIQAGVEYPATGVIFTANSAG